MKKFLLLGGFLILGLILFVTTITNIGIRTIMATILNFKLGAFLLFLLVAFINHCVASFRWKMIIKTLGENISLWKMILHTFAGFTLSYLMPSTLLGGEPIRIYLLHKEEGISTKDATFSVIVDKALELTTVIILIFISILLAFSEGVLGKNSISAVVIATIITIGILGAFYWLTVSGRGFFGTTFRFFQMHRIKRIQKWEEKITTIEKRITSFFIHDKKTLLLCFSLALLVWIMRILETFTILYFLNVSFSFSALLIISFLPLIALLMPVPGGLGMMESGTAAIMALLGMNPQIAISLVLITRIRDILWIGVGIAHTSQHSIKSIFGRIKS